jgi:hypothetical protein
VKKIFAALALMIGSTGSSAFANPCFDQANADKISAEFAKSVNQALDKIAQNKGFEIESKSFGTRIFLSSSDGICKEQAVLDISPSTVTTKKGSQLQVLFSKKNSHNEWSDGTGISMGLAISASEDFDNEGNAILRSGIGEVADLVYGYYTGMTGKKVNGNIAIKLVNANTGVVLGLEPLADLPQVVRSR